ncbi:Glycosyl transferase family 2 [Selenomonas sp. KH1T6]|nr:Glycosyl transferase family 2 [Selenomonas ruminantium]
MKSGLVSIIMPTYNRAGVIGEAIRSALAQTYSNFELIIVDDGSKDNTAEVVRQFDDDRIVYHAYAVNQGGNHARNIGLEMAQGEYICFLDTDNKWLPDFLRSQLDMLGEFGADISLCRLVIFDPRGNVQEEVPIRTHPLYQKKGLVDLLGLAKSMLGENSIDTNVVCIKRKCLESMEGFNEKLKRLQDWEFFLRMVLPQKHKVVYNPVPLVHSFMQADSIRFKQDFLATFLYVFERWLPLYQAYGMTGEQCDRIIRLTRNKVEGKARQDALAGLLRFIPYDEVEASIIRLKLNPQNLRSAHKVEYNTINLGGWYSVLQIAKRRRTAVCINRDAFYKLGAIPEFLLEFISFIVCDDFKGVSYRGIPLVTFNSLADEAVKLFVIVIGGYEEKKRILCDMGYRESTDFIDANDWLF